MPAEKWLGYYSKSFDTVELNYSFYRLPTEKAFAGWQASVPANFKYAVKVSRYITHIKRLKNAEEALEKFIARALLLENKLEVLLYQLPPQMKLNLEILENFLKLLPYSPRHVFEFRNQTWIDDSTFDLLKKYNAGFCVFDMPEYTSPLITTSNFAYLRFHGSRGLYWSNYSDEELQIWAKKIKRLASGLESVYIYFNNDAGAFAIDNSQTLKHLLTGI